MLFKAKSEGFTLIEVIIVIAVLGILASAALPRYLSFIEKARIAGDQAVVNNLNKSTQIFRYPAFASDPFLDEDKSNEELLQVLVDADYLANIVEPQSSGTEFSWQIEDQKWYLLFAEEFYLISASSGLEILGSNDYYTGRIEGSYSGSAKSIMIPNEIDGTELVEIHQDVFKNKDLNNLVFADDSKLIQIHARAFQDNNLTEINFPDSLKKIDTRAFLNNDLNEVTLPINLEELESHAFANNDIVKITVGDNLVSIGDYAFENKNKEDRTQAFRDAYAENGAGTYIYLNGSWQKQ